MPETTAASFPIFVRSVMTQDLIRYDLLAQDALRGVVRRVLIDVAKGGLPGNHHFYIAFDTRAPGVRVSQRLREKYPEEITVVMQHQFWDLVVTDYAFEVGLSFGNVPERLLVPFDAVKGFFDPSVQFGLQFEVLREQGPTEIDDQIQTIEPHQDNEEGAAAPTGPVLSSEGADAPPASPAARKGAKQSKPKAEKDEASEAGREEATGSAEVVSLDAFRKKT